MTMSAEVRFKTPLARSPSPHKISLAPQALSQVSYREMGGGLFERSRVKPGEEEGRDHESEKREAAMVEKNGSHAV